MKKKIITMLVLLTVSAGVMAGCSKETKQDKENEVNSEAVSGDSGAAEGKETEGTGEEISQVTGTLDEVKDFMFVVTDDAGISYAFTFEEKPEGLEQVAVGDKVIVEYTGTLSEVDPFTGEVLSIEKQS